MKRALFPFFLLAMIAVLVRGQPESPPELPLSIQGITIGMPRAEVERVLGLPPGAASDSFLTRDDLEVMFGDDERACWITGPELWYGEQRLRHPLALEEMEAVLGRADSRPPHRGMTCVYGALGFYFERYSLGGHLASDPGIPGQFWLAGP